MGADAAVVTSWYHLDVTKAATLAPDPVIEEYKKHVDLSLLERNLARSPNERLEAMIDMLELVEAMRHALGTTR
jgi:hypothetical protein